MRKILTLATALVMVVATSVNMEAMAAKKSKKGGKKGNGNEFYYEYKGVAMSGREAAGGTVGSFFDGESEDASPVYSSCNVAGKESAIDFILCDFMAGVALYSPESADNIIKGYRCGKVGVNANGEWSEVLDESTGTVTKFIKLDSKISGNAALIEAFENGTVTFAEGSISASKPNSKGCKIFPADLPCYVYAYNFKSEKAGVIKVTSLGDVTAKGRIVDATFDIIWQK